MLKRIRGEEKKKRKKKERKESVHASSQKQWDFKECFFSHARMEYDELFHYYQQAEKREIPGGVTGEAANPSCGDTCTVYLKIEDDRIMDASFTGESCALSTAYTAKLLSMIRGKKLEEIERLREEDVLGLFGMVDAPRLGCALLGYRAVKAALQAYKKEKKERNE